MVEGHQGRGAMTKTKTKIGRVIYLDGRDALGRIETDDGETVRFSGDRATLKELSKVFGDRIEFWVSAGRMRWWKPLPSNS